MQVDVAVQSSPSAGPTQHPHADHAPALPGPTLPDPTLPDPDDRSIQLSFSRVDAYETCPLRFRFAYVDRLPRAPSPHLSWGSTIHKALEVWWDRKLPEPPDLAVLHHALYEHWDDTGFRDRDRDEKIVWYRHAQDVLTRHHERHAATYRPAVAVEQWFDLDLDDDVRVVGSIDHVARTDAGGIGIVDWKTNRRAKPRDHVSGSLQLAIYALAARQLWGQDPEWVALDFVVPGVRVTVGRDEIDVDGAVATIRDVAARIRDGAFAPTPSRLCSWCDFRDACPAFEGEGPDLAGLAVVELTQLRRRRTRDERRIAELERIVRERLGEGAIVDVG